VLTAHDHLECGMDIMYIIADALNVIVRHG
jgi:hypothetical protein